MNVFKSIYHSFTYIHNHFGDDPQPARANELLFEDGEIRYVSKAFPSRAATALASNVAMLVTYNLSQRDAEQTNHDTLLTLIDLLLFTENIFLLRVHEKLPTQDRLNTPGTLKGSLLNHASKLLWAIATLLVPAFTCIYQILPDYDSFGIYLCMYVALTIFCAPIIYNTLYVILESINALHLYNKEKLA